MRRVYDLVIVGAGSAGLAAAEFGRHLGLRIALAERHRIGGDCTWTGCVPSKALLHAAEIAHCIRSGGAIGLPPQGDVKADLEAVMAGVHAARERVYVQEAPEAIRAKGIDVFLGPTTFRDAHTLQVGGDVLSARRFLLCTGALPAVPRIPGLADGPYLTNHNVFGLTVLPERLVVLGGGPVGVELAQAFRRLGSAVTLIGRHPRLLPQADPEASAVLLEAFQAEGIKVQLGTTVDRVDRGATTRVLVRTNGKTVAVEADAVLVALGRTPNVEGLGLERAGVARDANRVIVDAWLRTSQRHILAAGDVVGSFQFTHYAGWQAVIALRNAYFPGRTPGLLAHVPWTVFTDPEVAQTGVTEAEARQNGEEVRVNRWPLDRNDRAQTAGERRGLLKVVVDRKGRIRGATIAGRAAGELISEVTVAMDNRLELTDLARSMHAYPTYGFNLQMAAAETLTGKLDRGLLGIIVKALVRFRR